MAEDKEGALLEKVLAYERQVAGDVRLRQSLYDRIRQLSRPQKIMLALRGDRESRMILLKSYDPQVYHFLVQNPRLTSEEAVELTKSDLLQPHTIELITRNREWMKNERIKLHLAVHPKAPTGLSLNVLGLLSYRSLKEVARNPYVRGPVRRAAIN
ncbi:hypothetical protein MYX77_07340 [Acidobacteriia bacterium AH_259_A11_L15]|nr:hypothetical protein [Acidobacteriia bacterium AH_259_A11_L15]